MSITTLLAGPSAGSYPHSSAAKECTEDPGVLIDSINSRSGPAGIVTETLAGTFDTQASVAAALMLHKICTKPGVHAAHRCRLAPRVARGGHHPSDRRLRVLPMVARRCRRAPGTACPAVHTDTTNSLGWSLVSGGMPALNAGMAVFLCAGACAARR